MTSEPSGALVLNDRKTDFLTRLNILKGEGVEITKIHSTWRFNEFNKPNYCGEGVLVKVKAQFFYLLFDGIGLCLELWTDMDCLLTFHNHKDLVRQLKKYIVFVQVK